MKEFFVIDDFDLRNKTVAIRVDLNSDLINGKIEKNERFEKHAKSIRELIEIGAKVIILAHQSRKGEPDFISLEQHSNLLEKEVGYDIEFINDVVGERAKKAIENLKSGSAILLDNVRFLEDEDIEKSIEEHSNSTLVRFLSKYIDYYVLDAFSVAHRSHASIVGFAKVKPMIAGRVLEKEVESVKNALRPLGINVWLIGGAKIDDVIPVLEHMFKNRPESIERVLCGGLLANMFLMAKGINIGKRSIETLEKKNLIKLLDKAKELLENYSKEIVLPIDVAIEENGKRKEVSINKVPEDALILDIGSKTIEEYKRIIKEARSIIIKGPMGMFEKKGFERGTKELLGFISSINIYSLVGGGDTSVAIEKLNIPRKFNHISVGGGALLNFLSGKPMPGLEALKISYQIFKK